VDDFYRMQIDQAIEKEEKELSLIRPILLSAWCKDTASPVCQELWSTQNPAWGQCAVTALLLQDIFKGELLRTVVDGFWSHYYNRFPSGQEVDLTRGQFPKGTVVPYGQPIDRHHLLESERAQQAKTKERYESLKANFYGLLLSAFIDLTIQKQKVLAVFGR